MVQNGHGNPGKVMAFLNPIFRAWKSHEIQSISCKVLEKLRSNELPCVT